MGKKADPIPEDYVKEYEKAIHEVVKACGSQESASKMLDELHRQYEKVGAELKKLEKEHKAGSASYERERRRILERGKYEVHKIIEKHVPHVSWHLEELIIGTSLAVTAAVLPAARAAHALIAATSIIAIGSSYYIGFKLLRNWKAIAGKHKIADLSHIVGPKHIAKKK
ncbi:MAG: hypothetical protein N3F07_00640 [Candidatus Micrarchaeota archaeon]|nr:hypothetical protein [Candidatus Micrarchaeota archaeon]